MTKLLSRSSRALPRWQQLLHHRACLPIHPKRTCHDRRHSAIAAAAARAYLTTATSTSRTVHLQASNRAPLLARSQLSISSRQQFLRRYVQRSRKLESQADVRGPSPPQYPPEILALIKQAKERTRARAYRITYVFLAACVPPSLLYWYGQYQQASDPQTPSFAMRFATSHLVGNTLNWYQGNYETLLTPAFTHANPLHLGLNGFAIYTIGPLIATILGYRGFVALWVVGSLCSAACSLYWQRANFVSAYNVAIKTAQRLDDDAGQEYELPSNGSNASGKSKAEDAILNMVRADQKRYSDNPDAFHGENPYEEQSGASFFGFQPDDTTRASTTMGLARFSGASGVISAQLGYLAVVMPSFRLVPLPIFVPVPIRVLLTGFTAFSLWAIQSGFAPQVGHVSHVSGLLSGLAYGVVMRVVFRAPVMKMG